MQLVIIAGGKGTRLKERLGGDLPKAMVQIGGIPLIERLIVLGKQYGCSDVLLLTGYGAEHLEQFCGDGSRWGVRIWYHRESRPLGTAGALLDAFDKLQPQFIVMYGDTMMSVDLDRFARAHPSQAAATLFLHPNDHPVDSDLVELDPNSKRVTRFHSKPHPGGQYFANLVNAALYVCSKDHLAPYLPLLQNLNEPLDFGKHLFPAMLTYGHGLYGYISREYIKDAGTPHRLDQVEADLKSGRIERGSLQTPLPAVFLDRDGTLNLERGFTTSPEQLELIPGAAEAVRNINRAGWLAVVVTNQPVIARGDCSEEELRQIHNKLEWLLGESHAFLDGIYFCPHHPDKGFPGERPELKMICDCRKPATALLQQATSELNIDLKNSWMVGDRASDIQAGARLGLRTALVKTGFGLQAQKNCQPTAEFADVQEAAQHILTSVGQLQ